MENDITLRAPEPEDVNIIYIWENSSDESHSSLRTGPLSRFQIQNFIENYDGEIYSQGVLRYMIEYAGKTVGTVDIFDYDHRSRHAFVGIYVSCSSRRKGIARSTIAKVEELMKQKVGMYSLAALVSEDNAPSRALFESAGYRNVGTLNGWLTDGDTRINALLYQHIL